MIPYGRQWIDEEDIQAVVEVLRSDWITQGPKIEKFEKALASYCSSKYAVAVSSGTAALHLACLAAGIGPGDEVITSPITFVASANCILYAGGRPVFADVQPDTINIDPKKIKELFTPKIKAIIPVHFAGHPCKMEKIYEIAQEHNAIVIEDACHALGAEYRIQGFKDSRIQGSRVKEKTEEWTKVGSCLHSDMTVFSFHPVKHITTGEGGAILTNRKDLFEKLQMLRHHGITKDGSRFAVYSSRDGGPWYYELQELGFNYRLTDIQCALGLSQLKKLDDFLKRRREIVDRYNEAFKETEGIKTPIENDGAKSAWHIYAIRLDLKKLKKTRTEIFESLRAKGIGVQVHYIPVYQHPYYQSLGYVKGFCPEAERYYEESITLPLFPRMADEEVKKVICSVKNVILEVKDV